MRQEDQQFGAFDTPNDGGGCRIERYLLSLERDSRHRLWQGFCLRKSRFGSPEKTRMEEARFSDCPEDCPRCNRCPHSDMRRQKIEALIQQVEMEKERYGADGMLDLLPGISWHERVMEALAA